MKQTLALTIVVLFISSCASKPEDISSIYYPNSAYTAMDCGTLSIEMNRIQDSVLQATGQQRKDRKKDQAWGWTGAILFAPALLLMDGNDENATRLASLKGQFEAVNRVAAAKQCGS
jgi:hypothetical protein